MRGKSGLIVLAIALVTMLVPSRGLFSAEAEKPQGAGGAVEKRSEMKLLDPGSEPFRPLRYRFETGRTETVTMEMRSKMAMTMGDRKMQPMAMPTTRSRLRMDQKGITPEGNLRYEYVIEKFELIEEPGVSPLIFQAMKSAIAGMEGLRGRGLMSPSGRNLEAQVDAPPNASPQLNQVLENFKQSFRNLSAQFPEEPVGKGGRWQAVQLLETPAATIEQTATYAVADLEGDEVTLEIALEQSAAETPARTGAQTPPVKLKGLESKGAGTSRIDLDRLLPRSELKMSTTSDMEGGPAQGGMKMRMQMELTVRVTPEEAKAAPEPGSPSGSEGKRGDAK